MAEPLLACNLGTGTPKTAVALVEYCNVEKGSKWSDLRRAHGDPQPHRVKYWCLGNEMDGPWQIGRLTAREYGRKARDAARQIRVVDPDTQLIASGSSNTILPTYLVWDREVLEECYDQVDAISLHNYYGNTEQLTGHNSARFLAMNLDMERQIHEISGEEPTHWAPEVFTVPDGLHHMFLSVVPGVFEDWNHPRLLVHLTSQDLRQWRQPQALKLSSDRVIDACILRLPDGTWRLWYNNERDRKSICFADSKDLAAWEDRGQAVGDQAGEGPKVFRWRESYWMITDVWRALAVYRSEEALNWTRQPANLLEQPGRGTDDEVKGGHADVVVSADRAFLFYFTHPGRRGADETKDGTEQRRSSIQVVELQRQDRWLICDRDQPARIRLQPPTQ